MTRILVDLLFFTGKKGGMESYVREVYTHIAPSSTEFEFVGLASSELAAMDTSWFPGEIVDSGISGENRIAWARGELFSVARFARRLKADLIHCPANLGPLRSRVPVALTVHDLLPFRHPEYVPGAYSRILRAMIRLGARTASRLLTVSEASKADIVGILKIAPSRIDVIPLAGSSKQYEPSQSKRMPNQILSVGNRMPHKNLELLLAAVALIPASERPQLVVTGSHGIDPLTRVVSELGLERWVSLRGWLSATELEDLYASATLFVFPSLFEGFGLPVIEAMARGCPVLCSDIPVLREVGVDAVAYVDPHSASSLAGRITELVHDDTARDELARRGRDRAALFSWGRAADETVQSFRRALAER
ncbi:glycosyltransferase family 4 protein [Leifsonia sp. YAF41]|uniref:glycosyltransferase family 4 protein n=1 Tax=Leifsonia sp. YAF41 TaxID=3233086 RepID=UPI003F9DD10E